MINKKLTPFKWCMLQNFPFIEATFDAIDNYELLCKIVEYVNKNIDKTNELGIKVEELNNWFNNLDVQTEINNKLDKMAEDGELSALIEHYINPYTEELNNNINEFKNDVNADLSNFQAKINDITSGSPKGVYASVNDLITNNPDTGVYLITANNHAYFWTKNSETPVDLGLYLSETFYQGNIIELGFTTFEACKNDGYYNFNSVEVASITDKPINLNTGGILQVFRRSSGNVIYQFIYDNLGNTWFRYGNLEFTQINSIDTMHYNGNIIDRNINDFNLCTKTGYYNFSSAQVNSIDNRPVDLSEGGIIQVFRYSALNSIYQFIYDNNGNMWFRNTIEVGFTHILGNKLLNYNGNIISLNYTSFLQAQKNGYYNFSLFDLENITDKPINLNSGGILIVYSNSASNVVYQFIRDNYGNEWFRYENMDFVQTVNINTFQKNVKWIALGDSITEGYYSVLNSQGEPELKFDSNKCWTSIASKILNFELTNKAVGGIGFVDPASTATGENEKQLVDTIDFSDYNLCTIFLGINDWKGNQPLGSFNDDINTSNTFYANARYVIEKIINDNPNCKIILITPLNSSINGTYETNWGLGYSYTNSGTLEQIFNALVEICNYYNIQYIDMTHYSSINRININNVLPDKVHPTLTLHEMLGYELSKKITF